MVRRELESNVVRIYEVERLRKIDIGTALAFACAVHIGASEDREKIGGFGEGIIRKLNRAGSSRLAGERFICSGDGVDPIE